MSWNLNAAIRHLVNSASGKSLHQCAKYVRQAIEAGGISTAGRPVSACKYKNFLPTIGFNLIGQIRGKIDQAKWSNKNARPGDIAVMNHGEHGHICMWSGKQWISDFRQNNMWPYGGEGTCYIFRYNGQIDGSLGAWSGFGTTGLRYTVPLSMQQDHILLENYSNVKYGLVSEVLEFFGELGLSPQIDMFYSNKISQDDSSLSEAIVETGLYWAPGVTQNIEIYGDEYNIFGTINEYHGSFDGDFGYSGFPKGKGKVMNPDGMYDLFHTFGYGINRSAKYTGVECCEKIINTFIKYINNGCKTLQNLFMMYHLGMSGTWEQAKQNMINKGGLRDQGTGRFIPASEWIKMQEAYQSHGSQYMHMPLNTIPMKTKSFLYPLVTFISRQEQGVNCEAAADLAFKKMGMG